MCGVELGEGALEGALGRGAVALEASGFGSGVEVGAVGGLGAVGLVALVPDLVGAGEPGVALVGQVVDDWLGRGGRCRAGLEFGFGEFADLFEEWGEVRVVEALAVRQAV